MNEGPNLIFKPHVCIGVISEVGLLSIGTGGKLESIKDFPVWLSERACNKEKVQLRGQYACTSSYNLLL